MTRVFDEFLQTGRLARIQLGCSQEEVLRILGSPPETGNKKVIPKGYELWKYGGTQLAFANDRLILMGLYFHGSETQTLPVMLGAERLPFTGNTKWKEFTDYLGSRGVGYRQLGASNDLQLLSSKAIVAFDDNDLLEKILVDAESPYL